MNPVDACVAVMLVWTVSDFMTQKARFLAG